MTLLVALKGEDGLALAADSRGTFGDPRGVTAQNDSQQKAQILAPHVAALQAGAGEVGVHACYRFTAKLRKFKPLLDACVDRITAALCEQMPELGSTVAIDASDMPAYANG